jgi:hypothetical protein
MPPEPSPEAPVTALNPFTAGDVAVILRARGWLRQENEGVAAWLGDAAALLGPHAADQPTLGELLALVFEYDARAVLARPESHAALAREGAREVLRALAIEILGGGPVDSDRLKEIVAAVKERLPFRDRRIFFPLRLALAGRTGEGELDRVILLLDAAARTEGLAPVKSVRARILEFCAALD